LPDSFRAEIGLRHPFQRGNVKIPRVDMQVKPALIVHVETARQPAEIPDFRQSIVRRQDGGNELLPADTAVFFATESRVIAQTAVPVTF
jgi:hypothetical protein